MTFSDSSNTGLKKTTEEKNLIRVISALEESIFYEKDLNKKEELEQQLEGLKSQFSRGTGDSYTEIRFENQELKNQLKKLKEKTNDDCNCLPCDELKTLYRILLRKHAEQINRLEEKTVGEIKSIISKDDLTINSIIQKIKPENYSFENHYFQASEKAFNYVKDNIKYVKSDIPISFWLSPKEIVSEQIGDDEDQATFLCSLLYTLGDENAEVAVAEMENNTPHAFVITEWDNKFLLLDPSQKTNFRAFFGDKKEVLEKYLFDGSHIKRFLYRFNHSKYEQFNLED